MVRYRNFQLTPGLLVGLTEAAAEGPELVLVAQGREAEVRLELGDCGRRVEVVRRSSEGDL